MTRYTHRHNPWAGPELAGSVFEKVMGVRLHDLVSLLDFLNNDEEYPETFTTAIDRLDRILGLV